MIQKQKIDAQYLKFIGVTLMMTAVCVSDTGTKRVFRLADDQVREIILEQFHFLSSGQFAEVIEWSHAINEGTKCNTTTPNVTKYVYFKLLVTKEVSQVVLDQTIDGNKSTCSRQVQYAVVTQTDSDETGWKRINDRNKHSLESRAGPLA